MKKLNIEMSQKQADYLQRLGMEMNARYDIVARIIENNKNDADDSVLTSAVFIKYHREAIESKLAYEVAKDEFAESFIRPIVEQNVGKKDIAFTWNIPSFSRLLVEVSVDAL